MPGKKTNSDQREYNRSVKNARRIALVGMLVMFVDLFSYSSMLSGGLGFLGMLGLGGIFAGLVMQQVAKYRLGAIEKIWYWIAFDLLLLIAVIVVFGYLK